MSNKVVTSDCNGVRTITLQRPEKKNALDAEMFEGLTKQLRRAAVGEEVKVPWLISVDRFSLLTFLPPQVVVVTGAGEHFSSGNDLGNFLTAVSSGVLRNLLMWS